MNLRYHEHVKQEVAEATAYYANIRPKLGAEFAAALSDAIEQIRSDPLRFEQVRPGIRRCLLNRFPYGVYYRMPDENTVLVVIVRHHSRRPGLGMRRTES